jgi:non-canonical purine NTP pyrophosphatase (RdgB/HAM1 family)
MHKILIATHNKNKYIEFKAFFAEQWLETTAAFEQGVSDVIEGDISFAENARLKADHGLRLSGLPTLGEDSGLEIPALNNFPGVITKRFTDECGGYQSAVSHYLDKLGVETCDARYVAELCLSLPDQQYITTRATLEGSLIRTPRGEGIFGYDPWFVPKGFKKTCAELTVAQKQEISHRGKALRQLMEQMQKHDFFRAIP